MSYDISLTEKQWVDAEVADIGNYTSNVSQMYVKAIGKALSEFDGLMAKDAIHMLKEGVAEMRDNPDEFKKLNPINGWGDYEGALDYLRNFLQECEKNPSATIKID